MLESIMKILLAGLGAANLSREKLQTTLEDLVARGELTKEQGAALLEAFLARYKQESHLLGERAVREVLRLLDRSPFVSRRQFQRLEERVRALEALMGARAGSPDTVTSSEGTSSDGSRQERPWSEEASSGEDSSRVTSPDVAAGAAAVPDEVEPRTQLEAEPAKEDAPPASADAPGAQV